VVPGALTCRSKSDTRASAASASARLAPATRASDGRQSTPAAPPSSPSPSAYSAALFGPLGSPPSRPPGRRLSDLRALLCRKRASCVTFATTAAGTDVASGRKRLLVPVRIGPAVHADRDEACVAHEVWLVTEGAGAFQIEQLLLADCTRETPWPIETTIEGDVASLNRGGLTVPSNWYGTEVVSFDLLWPRFSGLRGDYGYRGATCPQELTTSLDEGFTGEVTWRKTAKDAANVDEEDVCTKERTYVPIPIVALPQEFENGGFRTIPFDGCSTLIDGTGGGRGVTVVGMTAGAADVTLRVVLSKQAVLYVAVADDHFTGASANPSADDHLEVWASPESDGYMSLTGERPKPEHFRIRVADGRVFGVESTAAPPSVERAERQGHVVLRIRLPADAAKPHRTGIALANVDADTGQPPARVATGHAEVTTASSLGVARDVHKGVTCRIDGGALLRSVPAKGREQPLHGP